MEKYVVVLIEPLDSSSFMNQTVAMSEAHAIKKTLIESGDFDYVGVEDAFESVGANLEGFINAIHEEFGVVANVIRV